MSFFTEVLWESVALGAAAAPFLLFGLLIAGLMHVLLPESLLLSWMGRRGLSGAVRAALIGIPLPICSCGVVPVAVELRRKGASQPASLSFLTTTPESSIDSILLTWGTMGPVMAIARPIAAFLTAMIGGVLAIAYLPERRDGRDHACAHDHGPDCHHDHGPVVGGSATAWRDLAEAGRTLFRWPSAEEGPGPWRKLWEGSLRPALRYGFVELLHDLAFWLLLGLLIAGLLSALLPGDLAELGLGSGFATMLVMLVVGIPLYMCASASTPIAAVLLAKGLSPGAVLVFLLAGPATNAATLLLLGRTLGRRFVKVYLVAIVAGALLSGVALDALAAPLGLSVAVSSAIDPSARIGAGDWLLFALLFGLVGWRLARGAAASGWRELSTHFLPTPVRALLGRLGRVAAGLAVLLYLFSGWKVVPADGQGFRFRFGRLTASRLPPGLHGAWPRPFGRIEVWRVSYPRKADIGFKADLAMIADRRRITLSANPTEWHSPLAAMNTDPEVATYLTADENLVEMSFTVHYRVADPEAFFYRLDHRVDVIALYASAVARGLVASWALEPLLTTDRRLLEEAIDTRLAERAERVGLGVEIRGVRLVDLHPPNEVVDAFRDVASAREDRETRVHRAWETLAGGVPRARGEAARLLAEAEARAAGREVEARGKSEAFVDRARALTAARGLLSDLLWRESVERSLPRRDKVILPKGKAGRGITLWRDAPAPSREGGRP